MKNQEIKRQGILLEVEEEKSCIDTTYFKFSKMFFPETEEYSEIRKIDRILWDDNKYFILDTSLKSFFIFHESGKHLQTIRNIGAGPGEYIILHDACLDTKNKHILLFGEAPYKIISFDYTGEKIKEVKTDLPGGIKEISWEDEKIITLNHLTHGNDNYLNAIDINNSKTNSLLYSEPINFNGYTWGNIMSKNEKIHFSQRFENSIYELNNLEITEKYTIDFKDYNIPFDLTNKNNVSDKLKDIYEENLHVYTMLNIHENESYLAFTTNIPGFYIYSKKDKILKKHSFLLNSHYHFYASRMINIDNSENKIAFEMEPQFFFRIKEHNENLPEELSRLIDQIGVEDNPILMICEFKD